MTSRAPRRSSEDWLQIIAEHNQSGLGVEEFCARHGHALSTFNRWKLRFSRERREVSPTASTTATRSAFVEALPPGAGTVTISLGNAVRLECPLTLGVEQIARLALAVASDERI